MLEVSMLNLSKTKVDFYVKAVNICEGKARPEVDAELSSNEL
jgi:hypothetical protein